MIKAGRWLGVAVFAIAIALTPLTATFSHSKFEAWLPRWDWYGHPRVVLDDRTGLVMSMSVAERVPQQNAPVDRLLVVSWMGGCSDQVLDLTFEAIGDGYRVSKREFDNGCGFLVGLTRTLVLRLREPVDASNVQFDALHASVT